MARDITNSSLSAKPHAEYQYGWKTPYDLFHKYVAQSNGVALEHRKPNQAHLRVFGCKAFAMTANALKKTNRLQRLNPKAWIGYLVGYNSTNVYRIWNPVFNKIVLTRDVVFNEHETFNGSIEALKDDIRELDLEELSRLLQEHMVPEETGEGDEIPVQPTQEELEEVRDLIENEIQV